MQATPADVERFAHIEDYHRRVFAAMLASLDDSVGAVLKKLRDAGLEQNTLIFFLSDNGGPTEELTSRNGPLRGGKGQLWEGGIRVPFLAQWKGHLPAGKVFQWPVISLDMLPTAMAAAGAEPPQAKLDGVNLLPFLRGERDGRPHETLYWRMGSNMALRQGDWKLVRQNERGNNKAADFQLFDLPADAGEKTDLIRAKPEKAAELRAVLDRLDGQMIRPRWVPQRK
jgi:arylsulfatase A-like enzyme